MSFELTDKEHFIRKFWLIVLIASSVGGSLCGFLFTPPALMTSKMILFSLSTTIFSFAITYYFVFKKHNNFIPNLIFYCIPFALIGTALPFFMQNSQLYNQNLTLLPQLAGLFAYCYLSWHIRYVNKKIQFQKKAPEDYAQSIAQIKAATNLDELQKTIAELTKKFPKFKLFFKNILKERTAKLSN